MTLGQVRGQVEIVIHGLKRFLIAIQPDKSNPRSRDHGAHPLKHSVARPQNRNQSQFFSYECRGIHHLKWCFNGGGCNRQIAGDLIGHQHRNFGQKPREILGGAVFIAHQAQLMLHKRMGHDGQCIEFCHSLPSSFQAVLQRARGFPHHKRPPQARFGLFP